MRRGGIAFGGRGVAIAAAELLLHLHGAHRRVHLDLLVELPVVHFFPIQYFQQLN
jgi:hypothetical protein